MTWACPACRTVIQHREAVPRPNVVYRCHVCRLELVVDQRTGTMTTAALAGARPDERKPKKKSGR